MDNLISRQAAIDAVLDRMNVEKYGRNAKPEEIQWALEKLPSAQPERKRGKWIEDDDGWDEVIWRCSECDAVFTLVDGTPEENEYNYCPHCGAKMEVSDGSD